MRIILVRFHDGSSFLSKLFLDHFAADTAASRINATVHQLVTLCQSIRAEERKQLTNFWNRSWRLYIVSVSSTFSLFLVFIVNSIVYRASDGSDQHKQRQNMCQRAPQKRPVEADKQSEEGLGWMNWVAFVWKGYQAQAESRTTFTVAYAKRMCPC